MNALSSSALFVNPNCVQTSRIGKPSTNHCIQASVDKQEDVRAAPIPHQSPDSFDSYRLVIILHFTISFSESAGPFIISSGQLRSPSKLICRKFSILRKTVDCTHEAYPSNPVLKSSAKAGTFLNFKFSILSFAEDLGFEEQPQIINKTHYIDKLLHK